MVSLAMNIPGRPTSNAQAVGSANSREEASPSYDTYETASIYCPRRLIIPANQLSPQNDIGNSPPSSRLHKRRLSEVSPQISGPHHNDNDKGKGLSAKTGLLSPFGRGSWRSSLLIATGSRDPLIGPLVGKSRQKDLSLNLSDKNLYMGYPLRRNEMCRLFSDKLSCLEKIPRLNLGGKAKDGEKSDLSPKIGDKSCDFLSSSNFATSIPSSSSSFPTYIKYNHDDSAPSDGKIQKHYKQTAASRRHKSVMDDLVVTKHVCNCGKLGGKTHIHRVGNEKGVGVPCLQKSDSLTDSELDIGLSRRKRCSRKWCLCLILALLLVALASAAIIYFAYRFVGHNTPHERVYKGSFRVEGPLWSRELENRRSPAYRATLEEYKKRLDMTYESSVFKKAFIRSEIINLERSADDSLVVHFNLHINHLRLKMDAADLFLVLMSEIRRKDSAPLAGIQIDEDTVEIQERVPPSAIPNHPNSRGPHNSPFDSNPAGTQPVATASSTTTPAPRVCTVLNLKFCSSLHHNITTYPNLFGHKNLQGIEEDLIAIREVVDSECHTLAFEFLCEALQPDCRKYSQPTPRGTFEDEMVLPCQDFCKDVMSSCEMRLPTRLRNFLQCDKFPLLQEGGGCTAKPGCTRELRVMGWPERVCDGVVDCEDMSDEDQCLECTPEGFRCGSGLGCVTQAKRCDGINDCTNGADEKGCLSLTPTPTDRNTAKGDRWIKYNREGLLRYTEAGQPYRVCVDNINKTLSTPEANQLVHNMAEVTCANFTYGVVDLVEVVTEDVFDHVPGLGYVQIADVFTRNITFHPVNCTRRTVVFISCSELACGMRPLHVPPKDAIVERVVRTSASGDWPWVAALIKDGVHSCDATLIHPSWLITTSLCFQGQGRALWIARLGTTRISSKAPWVQERLIIGMVKNDEPTSKIVLIKLEKNLEMSDYVRPACLGSHHDPTRLTTRRCRALGWGARRDPLLELSVSVDSLSCDVLGPNTVPGSSFCARQISPTDRCLLEEMNGAGLLCEWADRWEVVGIAMGRTGCANGARPRTYENISPETVSWIKKTIAAFKRAA